MPRALPWRTLLTLSLATLLLAAPLFAQNKAERRVRALIDQLIAAANSVDPKAVRPVIAEHSRAAGPFFPAFADQLDSVAELEVEIEQSLANLAARRLTPTSAVSVQVDKKTAWAWFTWQQELTYKDGTRRAFAGRSTLVFQKEGKRWKLKHWHSSLPAPQPATATARAAEVESILALERAAWEGRKARQAARLEGYFTEQVSYFDDSQAYRVRGKTDALRGLAGNPHRLRSWQMLDPQVQIVGDTALLTYYFTESGTAAGKEYQKAGKISVVFVREDGGWRALHYHRSVNP